MVPLSSSGFQRKNNSALVIDLIEEGKLKAVISEQVKEEVLNYYSLRKKERSLSFLETFFKKNFEIVPRRKIIKTIERLRGKIKEKDLEHLATARVAGAWIVALDRHFKPFKEYLTPKQRVEKLGWKAFETDY